MAKLGDQTANTARRLAIALRVAGRVAQAICPTKLGSASDGKKTSKGKSVGLFFQLPPGLTRTFPPLGESKFMNSPGIPVSKLVRTAAAPKRLDHLGLLRHLRRNVTEKRRISRWEPMTFDGVALEVINPDPSRPDDLRIRFPGSSDEYRWSGATNKWRKSRRPPPTVERAKTAPRPLTREQEAFYSQSPQEIINTLKSIPRSMLAVLDLRRELLPRLPMTALVRNFGRMTANDTIRTMLVGTASSSVF